MTKDTAPKKKKAKEPNKKAIAKRKALAFKKDFLHGWFGNWATNPKNAEDRRAAAVIEKEVRFTDAGSVVMPVAVAAIDVLGVRSLLESKPLEEIAKKVAEPFYNLEGPMYQFGLGPSLTARQIQRLGMRRMGGILNTTISDTMLLARRPDWEFHADPIVAEAEAIIWLSQFVAKMTKINSAHGVPIRSAISFGECLVMVGERFALLGAPTREASEWEKCQEWAGGMLAPSAVNILRKGAQLARVRNGKDFNATYYDYLVAYPVPLKPDVLPCLPKPSMAINWVNSMLPGGMFMFKSVPPEAPTDARADVVRKVQNTKAFMDWCETTVRFDTSAGRIRTSDFL